MVKLAARGIIEPELKSAKNVVNKEDFDTDLLKYFNFLFVHYVNNNLDFLELTQYINTIFKYYVRHILHC
jgi:hypothetical protein